MTNGEKIAESKTYLETGGLGEVMGLATAAMRFELPKVEMDSQMAVALCLLAQEALNHRGRH